MFELSAELVRAIEAQKLAARSCVPMGAGAWSEGFVAALDWVLNRLTRDERRLKRAAEAAGIVGPTGTDRSWCEGCEGCETADDPCICELNEQRVTRARYDHLDEEVIPAPRRQLVVCDVHDFEGREGCPTCGFGARNDGSGGGSDG